MTIRWHRWLRWLPLALVALLAMPPAPGAAAASLDDLGSIGPSWPIAEPDLLDAMLDRVRALEANGEADRVRARLSDSARRYAMAPPSLGLPRGRAERVHAVDPSIAIPYAVADGRGGTLAAAGTRINPLARRAFQGTVVFLDASDEAQVRWLKGRHADGGGARDTIVLTGGAPQALAAELRRPVYFDQQAMLVRRFGIAAVPAVVAADPAAPAERLLVREVVPDGVAP